MNKNPWKRFHIYFLWLFYYVLRINTNVYKETSSMSEATKKKEVNGK